MTSGMYRLINEELEKRKSACLQWCQRERLTFDVCARLAHLVVNEHNDPYFWPLFVEELVPFKDQDTWRAALEWRHPQINLNLLQLSLLFMFPGLTEYLWHPVFLKEEDYRDESLKLVNHPLHLLINMSTEMSVNLDYIRDELFYEEGMIDLTPSRIVNTACTPGEVMAHPGTLRLPSARASRAASQNASVTMFSQIFGKKISAIPYFQAQKVRVVPLIAVEGTFYDFNLTLDAIEKLAGGRAQPSTVELVRDLATDTSLGEDFSHAVLQFRFHRLPQSLKGDTVVLLCQTTWMTADARTRKRNFRVLLDVFRTFRKGEEVHIHTALRFLSNDLIEDMCKKIEKQEGAHSEKPGPLTSKVLRDTLANRCLKDHCVLAVMKAVRGDARKVWSLDQLPEPLKKEFNLPLQTRFEELTAASQGYWQPWLTH